MFFKKGGEFKKSCSTMDETTGEQVGCICAGEDETQCEYYEEHHGEENKEIQGNFYPKLSDLE